MLVLATNFCIKKGYRENPGPVYFLDDPKDDDVVLQPVTFQPDVIPRAEALAIEHGITRLIDVGCGWADKLAALHARQPTWDLTGVDYGDNLKHCRETYDWGTWLEADLEREVIYSANDAIIVCSDVIEHLVDPTTMLASFRRSGARYVVFSTPERDVQYGSDHRGPSSNPCHVREWNLGELVHYLEASGLRVVEAGLTRGSDQSTGLGTSLVVTEPTL